jgi:hypothetical protein
MNILNNCFFNPPSPQVQDNLYALALGSISEYGDAWAVYNPADVRAVPVPEQEAFSRS